MSYEIIVKFKEISPPDAYAVRGVLAGYDIKLLPTTKSLLITDPVTGDDFTLEFQGSETPSLISLQVSYVGTLLTLVTAYLLAQSIADKFHGTVEDPQLGGPASLFLAKQEWKKRWAFHLLNRAFDGRVPNGLKLRLTQKYLMESQEFEILGPDVSVKWKADLKSGQYSIPILSLEDPREEVHPHKGWVTLIVSGLVFLGLSTVSGTGSVVSGILGLTGFAMWILYPILYWRVKHHLIVVPGYGGSLVMHAKRPSKDEVRHFLDSIDRVKVALTRYKAPAGRDEIPRASDRSII